MSLSGIQRLDNLINQVKTKVLECLNFLYRFIFEVCPESVKHDSPFMVTKSQPLVQAFISSAIVVAQRPDFETLVVQDEVNQNLVVELVEALTIFVNEKEFYSMFSNFYKHLLVIVALTFMKTSSDELDQMKADPDQFVALALDTCDK